MTLELRSAAVAVTDRKRSAKWYQEKLGFRVIDDDEHWLTVGDRSGSFRLHLCEMGAKPGAPPKRSEVGNTGILLVTKEPVLRAYARLKKKGVKFSVPAVERPHAGWVAKFLDPDGNEFWLSSHW
jgi:catechol 2,3-dioxygenase-like lactoylglutathione lyase family enzyme